MVFLIQGDSWLHCIRSIAGLVQLISQKGSVDINFPLTLDRMGVDSQNWVQLAAVFEQNTNTFVGAEAHNESTALHLGYKRTPNRQRCKSRFC